MDRMIFVNLPVGDLAASRAFYAGLGLAVDDASGDDVVVCVVVTGRVCLMLQDRATFPLLTGRPVSDPAVGTPVRLCLTATSRAEVDVLVAGALSAGGTELGTARCDPTFYARTVTDPDGHVWELLHADGPTAG